MRSFPLCSGQAVVALGRVCRHVVRILAWRICDDLRRADCQIDDPRTSHCNWQQRHYIRPQVFAEFAKVSGGWRGELPWSAASSVQSSPCIIMLIIILIINLPMHHPTIIVMDIIIISISHIASQLRPVIASTVQS